MRRVVLAHAQLIQITGARGIARRHRTASLHERLLSFSSSIDNGKQPRITFCKINWPQAAVQITVPAVTAVSVQLKTVACLSKMIS